MYHSAQVALKVVKSLDHVFIHSVASVPFALIEELVNRHEELNDVSIYSIHTEGLAKYSDIKFQKSFKIKPFFVGQNIRENIQNKRGSYLPVFLSEVPNLFRNGTIPLDIALISVSPPDKHGFCSLGPSVDISLAAIQSAKIIIAQVNRFIPRTHGDGFIHHSKISFLVKHDQELPQIEIKEISETHKKIGEHIAELVENGSTLQMGIGEIPNAVLSCLTNHKDLGIHSEMISDGILPLVEAGVITGSKKSKHKNSIIASFAVGTKKLYDFIDDNPFVKMLDFSYVNSVEVIRKNPKVVAINSAIEIDLSGQVCADSIGSKIFSGVGGQMDFIRGASLSDGGKPIIAMTATTKNGESKIVPFLKEGAGVVTTRAHVHWVVTEYGAVNLYGKTLEERAELLIQIAHPNQREKLKNHLKNS
ncbi:MAG: acetyl-CoA hydrolase/transferase family protein [Flavobacteriia bacterium]|jgi:4-hydroxybutyrate CoA-transferase